MHTGQYTAYACVRGTGDYSWRFTAQIGTSIGDKAGQAIARAIALSCAQVYENPVLAEQARKELLEETGGVYICLIPAGLKPGE